MSVKNSVSLAILLNTTVSINYFKISRLRKNNYYNDAIKTDDYNEAITHRDRLRPQEPSLFNANRLNELPIPLLEPALENIEQVFVEDVVLENSLNVEPVLVAMKPTEPIEQADVESTETENPDYINIKVEPELILMDDQDEEEFGRILQDDACTEKGDDLSDDVLNLSIENTDEQLATGATREQLASEVASTLNESNEIEFENVDSFPKPMACTVDVLSKFEDDPISGNLPYAPKVNFNNI